eukprot:TRINITY_DN5010_c0_g1_i1.p1 TRINITY_DN5010_c0_g1~~TRINITY_DN5010_c0_g1_i1.p1  ORF type:complete len:373 (-),score=84.39 TRINITY_DN5010_c0_g1_i1:156-1274(-)
MADYNFQRTSPHHDSSYVTATNMGKEEVQLLVQSNKRPAEKIEELRKKCIHLFEQINRKHQDLCEANGRMMYIQKELQSASTERDREKEKSSKLESLCREMQRRNKELTDMLDKIKDEEENKRLELSEKFDKATREVISKLEEHTQGRIALAKENSTLQNKLKTFLEQYEFRERHIEQLIRAKQLEKMLADTRVKQTEERIAIERQKAFEMEEQHRDAMTEQLSKNQELEAQIQEYNEKFRRLNSLVERNSDHIASMKAQMLELMKRNQSILQENDTVKCALKQATATITSYSEDCSSLKATLDLTRVQRDRLASLCRALQQEKTQMTEHNAQLNLRLTEAMQKGESSQAASTNDTKSHNPPQEKGSASKST